MWVDFWVLPMIVEAERGNVLPAWLKEAYGEGTSQLTFNTLIGVDFHPSVPQPTGSEGVLVDASAQPGESVCIIWGMHWWLGIGMSVHRRSVPNEMENPTYTAATH